MELGWEVGCELGWEAGWEVGWELGWVDGCELGWEVGSALSWKGGGLTFFPFGCSVSLDSGFTRAGARCVCGNFIGKIDFEIKGDKRM
jgi:hypothetical protein